MLEQVNVFNHSQDIKQPYTTYAYLGKPLTNNFVTNCKRKKNRIIIRKIWGKLISLYKKNNYQS